MNRDYERAMADIRRGLTKVNGGQSAENRMTVAYQAMVAAGEAPSIRRKYRTGKHHKQVR